MTSRSFPCQLDAHVADASGDVLDVAIWLRDLGLERYEAAFRDHEIDAEILPTLTAQDLIDLGVTIVGHRRRLLNAIASLSETTAAVPRRAAALASEPESPTGQRGRAAPADRDVLSTWSARPNSPAPRSRGHARGDPGLPDHRRRRDRPRRGPCRQIHGRWRARLFRLPQGPRGRRRARRSGRPGDHRKGRRSGRRTVEGSAPGSGSRPAGWWSAT